MEMGTPDRNDFAWNGIPRDRNGVKRPHKPKLCTTLGLFYYAGSPIASQGHKNQGSRRAHISCTTSCFRLLGLVGGVP
jgi:hypothetical protein